MDLELIIEQADEIAKGILNNNPESSETTNLRRGWIKYHLQLKRIDKSLTIRDGFMEFIKQEHSGTYNELVKKCTRADGQLNLHDILSYMSPDLAGQVRDRFGMDFNPEDIAEYLKGGLGNDLYSLLQSRYGISADDQTYSATDLADLYHAAFFHRFVGHADPYAVRSSLCDYLSSSGTGANKTGRKIEDTSMDAIVAFFNAYSDQDMVEKILTDIEKRVRFNRLAKVTRPYTHHPGVYREVLNTTLDEIIDELNSELEVSKLDGSRRILDGLITRYMNIKDFELPGVRDELEGSVFPRFYQTEAILDSVEQRRFLIADEMGTGKTVVAILTSEYMRHLSCKDEYKTLVVTPNSNKLSFAAKIHEYLEDDDPDLVSIINGGDRAKQYEAAQGSRYIIINYELIRAKDWKLQDFNEWDVDEEKYESLLVKAKRNILLKAKAGKKIEYEVLLREIKRIGNASISEKIKTRDEAYDTLVRLQDLGEAKSVYASLRERFDFDHIIIDEVHNSKNGSSKTAKAIRGVCEYAKQVTCLSGTPFVNGLSDLGILFDVLGIYNDLLEDGHEKLREMEAAYTSVEHMPAKVQKLYKQQEKELKQLKKSIDKGDIQNILLSRPRIIRDFLRPKMIRRNISEILEMPPVVFHPPLDPEISGSIRLGMYQRIGYETLASHDFGNGSDQLRGLNMYLLSPGLYSDGFRPGPTGAAPVLPRDLSLTQEDSKKYKKLEEIIQNVMDSDKKKKNIVVFSSLYRKHVTEYLEERLSETFDIPILRIDGTVNDGRKGPERTRIINEFNSDDPSVLIATLGTMKEAIELQGNCSTAIFLDLPYTWADYVQAVARVWRADQDEQVDVYNLLVSNSIDIGKLDLIMKKRRLATLLMEGAPLSADELKILDLNENDAKGMLDYYVEVKKKKAARMMAELREGGRDIISAVLGEVTPESELYADAYILDKMRTSSLKSTVREMNRLGVLDADEPESLDDKVLDIAAGYGVFSHVTGVRTHNLEINPIMIERAAEYAPRAVYTKGLMQDVHSIYSSKFPYVVLSLALHYAAPSEKGQLLYDIHNVMQDDGYLFITEPASLVDRKARKQLTKALEVTGFTVESGTVKIGGKKLYRITAQKTSTGSLYDKPIEFSGSEDSSEGEDSDCLQLGTWEGML